MTGDVQQSRRVVGVVQARMGSSRLPGKALAQLIGQPVIWHVMRRLAGAARLDQIVLATTTAPADDMLADYVSGLGIQVVRGSESNVLARFVQAAELSRADVVVRITGDCPLVDPWLVDYLVDALSADAGYVQVEPDGVLIDEGVDPCATWALHRLAARAGDDPVAQEHVTSYFKLHPDFVPIARCAAPPERWLDGARISVDTPADLRFLERVYERLGAPAGDIDVLALVDLLRREPALMAVNQHVVRKHARVDDRMIVVRCDGDSVIGLGHVVRCLAIAEALRDRHGLKVIFAVDRDAPARDLVIARGFVLAQSRGDSEAEPAWLDRLLSDRSAEAVVLDVRTGLEPAALHRWRDAGLTVATIDDGGPRRLAADLAFFPPVPQLRHLDWNGFDGAVHIGWHYLPLRRDFARTTRIGEPGDADRPHVLVAMGGADPAGATAMAVKALCALQHQPEITVVVGAAYAASDELEAQMHDQLPQARLLRNADDMPALLAHADLAVIAFGMTAYEAASVGTPALALCWTDDHAQSARALESAGALQVAGLIADVGADSLACQIADLMGDRDRLREMGRAARRLIDGRGADRISDRIVAVMDRSRGRSRAAA